MTPVRFTVDRPNLSFRPVLVLGSVLFLFAIGTAGCASPNPSLTDAQMQKLDPALQRLVRGEPLATDRYSTSTRDDGTTVYSVILRSDRPEALRDTGLPLNTVREDLITARLSVVQLRTAARLEAVRRIENPSQTHPTP